MPNIIVKNYEHYSHAMGKHISSKRQYDNEMAKGGYVPYEKGQQLAEQARARNHKNYDGLSEKTMRFLHEVKGMADKKGNIKVSDRFVEGLKEHGVKIGREVPKSREGGFY